MILHTIAIENYKSIEALSIPVNTVKNSYCFALLGINESGKSSILKGISLIDSPNVKFPIDYFDKNKPIVVTMGYKIESWEEEKLRKQIHEKFGAKDKFVNKVKVENIELIRIIENKSPTETSKKVRQKNGSMVTVTEVEKIDSIETKVQWKTEVIKGFKIEEDKIIESKDEQINLNNLIENHFSDFFWEERHRTKLWTSSPKYLITKPIDLDEFVNDPSEVSLPLYNSLRILGLSDQEMIDKIGSLKSAADISNFADEIGDKLTEFINDKWKKHPIKIRININESKLSFLIEDDKIPYKAKVVSQRSDGFKQLVSFLLTVAAENNNEDFNYKILLLDEPETHLHPSAQIDLLNELLNISNSKETDNIVFYSTHSPYMIDRRSLNRSLEVTKANNEKTVISKIGTNKTTFAEINYEIFDIPTTDYHNELYGLIEERKRTLLNGLPKDKVWFNSLKNRNENVSSSTYIRHSIHHPENDKNRNYSIPQLRKSIKVLRELRKKI